MRKIRIGKRRCNYLAFRDPYIPDYKNIVISHLSPFSNSSLKNEKGEILENVWTFSAVYEKIPELRQLYSASNKREIWTHKGETHFANGEITPEYWRWRTYGLSSPYGIEYSLNHSDSLFHVQLYDDRKYKKLSIIDAKYEIYLQNYYDNVKPEDLEILNNNENILLIDKDAIGDEDLPYFREKYNVGYDFIFLDTFEVNRKNLNIIMDDPKIKMCSAYALANLLI